MSEIIGIVGPVSSGKTTAARNLKSEETYFINCLSKKLPFKGSAKAYSAEKKNIANTDKSKEICALLKGVSAKRPEIKYIIVDDVSYTMSNEFFRRREESGYQKFSDIGGNMVDIIDTARSLRDDLTVIFMFHEHIDDNALQPTKKIKTIGKMVDDK